MISEFGLKYPNERSSPSKTRLILVMLFTLGLGLTVLVRAGIIQLVKNTRLEEMARRQFQTRALIRPRRGTLLDRNGEPLAINLEANSLAANPKRIQNKRTVAKLLARSTHLPYAKLFQKLSENREFVWIKRHLSELELKRFKKWRLMDSEGALIQGLWMVKESDRVYPQGRLASQILGGVNVDSEGLEGVELWMNARLRGRVVSVAAIKDALGRPTFIDAVAAKNVQDGESISLTLDASLQYEVEQVLWNAIQKFGARSGTVIVMNATNGEILALANEPGFNANEKGVPPDRRRNRALTDGFEPGSTLKAILAASALSNGFRLSDEVWGERGSFHVQGHKISEAEAHEKFEWVSLKKMIQLSSNVAAAKFALKLGADRYLKTLRTFGFGTKTGLGFPGEISGKVLSRSEWSPLSLANIGFGQGILVTPMQMTRAYAAILNGGWLVTPVLLKPEKKDQTSFEKPQKVISAKVAQQLMEALEAVTQEGGTGIKAALPGYRVAGKTGTAQMVDPQTGKYSKEKYFASFIGFPVGIEPKFVIFAGLLEPQTSIYATATAAPLFREVLSSVASRYSLPMVASPVKRLADIRVRDTLKLSQAAPGGQPEVKLLRLPQAPNDPLGWIMPPLTGLTPREAIRVLQGHRLQLQVSGTGVISSHTPNAGKRVAEGDTVRLILSEP